MNKYIYLAGPIAGCNIPQANNWRAEVSAAFLPGIVGVSPLRCEPSIDGTYQLSCTDPMYGTPRAISSKNKLDTASCDMVLMYLPLHLNRLRPSYGTTVEFGWATALDKPVVLVSDDPAIINHPLFQQNAAWILNNLPDAVDLINNIYKVYVAPRG